MTIASAFKAIPSYPLTSLSTSHLHTLLHGNKPFILAQCFRDMPAITRWTQQSYFTPFSTQPIEIEVSTFDPPGYGERHESTLGEFLALLSHPLPYRIYMAQFPLFEKIPELRNDILTDRVNRIFAEGGLF